MWHDEEEVKDEYSPLHPYVVNEKKVEDNGQVRISWSVKSPSDTLKPKMEEEQKIHRELENSSEKFGKDKLGHRETEPLRRE